MAMFNYPMLYEFMLYVIKHTRDDSNLTETEEGWLEFFHGTHVSMGINSIADLFEFVATSPRGYHQRPCSTFYKKVPVTFKRVIKLPSRGHSICEVIETDLEHVCFDGFLAQIMMGKWSDIEYCIVSSFGDWSFNVVMVIENEH